jgi:phosphoglucomutase
MNKEILDKAQAWVNNDVFDQKSKDEIKKLINDNDEKELTERFYKDLAFGTGGIRSILGAGLNRMNLYNIRKATQALCNEVLRVAKEENNNEPKAAIAYDSRKFSFEFAKETAAVFAANGIKAFIYDRLNPVAMLSFSVRYHKAQAGVMVTASHNPPEYNGYKVYWSDGAQVTPPNDKNIIDQFNSISDFATIKVMNFDEAEKAGMIKWVGKEVEDAYHKVIKAASIKPDMCEQRGKELSIVYTPIHGTGKVPCSKALDDLGLTNYAIVKEQAEPDSAFPTVSSPNPENPEAMAMAVAQMKETNADIVFGSDPDTDRLGVAIQKDGETVYLNGNQIGILLLHYVLKNLREQNRMPANPYFVKTIVTTSLQEKIAESFDVKTENTLTGFKWICGLVNQLETEAPERNFVFGTEESFGYLNHSHARDKDGVSSLSLMAETALWYKTQNMDLIDGLNKIYEEYGFCNEELLCLSYFGKEGAEKIERIMNNFRNNKYEVISEDKVDYLEDYLSGNVISFTGQDNKTLDLPSSNVLGFNFENGNKLYLRPSGTEPKIKFYIMIQENEGSLSEKKAKALKKTEDILSFLKSEAEKA